MSDSQSKPDTNMDSTAQETTDDEVCLFIACSLSMRSLKAVANAASELKARAGKDVGFRWVAPARYHVTLSYLGWTNKAILPALQDAVAKAVSGHKAFDMRCRDFGGYPNLEKAEILWAGIDDRIGELAGLANAVSSATEALGFPAAAPFQPHVTMARIPKPSDLMRLTQQAPAHVFSKTLVDHLILYKSSVESNSSEYETISFWPLE